MATTHGSNSAEQVAEALQFVVQHKGSSIDQQTLCRLLQTHSAIRRALQACRSQCAVTLRLTEADAASVRYASSNSSHTSTSNSTDIIVVAPLSESEEGAKVPSFADPPAEAVAGAAAGRQRLVWFARWMRRHAGLVSRCTVHMPSVDHEDSDHKDGVLIRLQLAMAKVLQDCAPPPAAAQAAPATGVTTRSCARGAATQAGRLVGVPLQLQSLSLAPALPPTTQWGITSGLRLQLQSFALMDAQVVPVVSRLLSVLAPMNVQELFVGELWEVRPGFCEALRALQSLRSLRLNGKECENIDWDPDYKNSYPYYYEALVPAVGSLQHLTSLHIDATVSMLMPGDGELLPESLGVLEGVFVQGAAGEDKVDLSRLTALTRLRWASAERYVADAKSLELVLPPKLACLVAGSPLPRVQGAQIKLQQLKVQLVLDLDCNMLASLLSLTTPAELSVVLGFSFDGSPDTCVSELTKPAVERAAAAVGACTSIVSFELDTSDFFWSFEWYVHAAETHLVAHVGWCRSLAKLPLERLVIRGHSQVPMFRDDMACLTALTRLSELRLAVHWDDTVADNGVSAVAFVSHLTTLQRLRIDSQSIDLALLPVVGQRTGLHSLYLDCAVIVTDARLSLLSTLTQLTSLTLVQHKCSEAAQARFRESVTGLSSIGRAVSPPSCAEYFD